MGNRAGTERTNFSGEAEYKSFLPTALPPHPLIEMDDEIVKLLVSANKQLAILESVSSRIPNVKLFVYMYIRKEALMSSQIEGTQATLEDILDPEADKNGNRDVAEVTNYIRAIEYSVNRLEDLPLCNRLLRETHAVLMEGVRGQEKSPGEFRRSQNWIGGFGSDLKTARYIPPNVDDMIEAMADLEKYINNDDDSDILIRSALIHYQFETIHPFLDGNGRIGRLLVTLILMERKVLSTPVLYISYFLKKNRIEYYDRLSEVRVKGNYEQWIKFFLRAIAESAESAVASVDKLTALHDKNIAVIKKMGRVAKTTLRVFEHLEINPIIEIARTAKALNLSFNTASAAIERLMKAGILVQSAGKQRNRMFSYGEYLDILKDGT